MLIENGCLTRVENEDIRNGVFVVPDGIREIYDWAFQKCPSPRKIIFSAGASYCGGFDWPFALCHELEYFEVEEGNQEFSAEDGVLFDRSKSSLFCYPAKKSGGSYRIPDGVMDIDNCAFQGCLGLTEIIIPSTVTFIGDWAFDGCFGLKVLCLPQQIRTKSLCDFIFRGCVSLAEMTVPNGVELIGWGAFQGCVSLKYISFPGTVRYIRKDAFRGCDSLSGILFRGTPQQWEKITIEEGNEALTAAKKVYPKGTP